LSGGTNADFNPLVRRLQVIAGLRDYQCAWDGENYNEKNSAELHFSLLDWTAKSTTKPAFI
jgi:hypothetical protein